MSTEKLSLAWNEFEDTSVQNCRNLLCDTEFVDVTLASHDDEQIQAHKVILCSASPFFKRIISKNKHQHPLLFLRNVQMKTLKSLINFIYLGHVEVEQEDLNEFLEVAKDFEIKGLSNGKNVQNKLSSTETDIMISNDNRLLEELKEEAENKCKEEEFTQEVTSDIKHVDGTFNQTDSLETVAWLPTLRDKTGNYPCNNCNYTATNTNRLKKHAYAVHEGVRYPCLHCEYKATQKSSLSRHIKRIHSSNI